MSRWILCLVLGWGLLISTTAGARGEEGEEPAPPAKKRLLETGSDAPEITATTWLNAEGGACPVPGDLTGKAVLVEFWGTWCGPCVRSMPRIQALHERYRHQGLIVVAITRESASDVRDWLTEREYTMAVGCDPSQDCITKWSIDGWPTTYLIGGDGKIVYAGAPYGVTPAIEKALGLESSPATLLTTYFDKQRAKDKDGVREALQQLVKNALRPFDLRQWAIDTLGKEPEAPDAIKKIAPTSLLKALEKLWLDPDAPDPERRSKRDAKLLDLAHHGPKEFDLHAWARALLGKRFPVKGKEVDALLEENRYRQLLDALLDRHPSSSVQKKAAKHKGFATWCNKGAKKRRKLAWTGLMAKTYLFADKPIKDLDIDAFNRDMSFSAWSEAVDEDGVKRIVGIDVGGEMVMKWAMPKYVERQLGRSLLMDAIASGVATKAKKLDERVEKERDKIVASIRRKYG